MAEQNLAPGIDGWYVEVAVNGERLLTIEHDGVNGLRDDLDSDAPIIRHAALQLIRFIGPGRDHVGNHVALSQNDSPSEEEPRAWLVEWVDPNGSSDTWVHVFVNESDAIDTSKRHNGIITPLFAAPSNGGGDE